MRSECFENRPDFQCPSPGQLREPGRPSHVPTHGGDWRPACLPGDDDDEEFDSLETIEAVAARWRRCGHEVELLGDGEPLLRRLLEGPRPDLVWNIAEGTGQGRLREARVPAVLEMLDIPYTGSDPLTLAATLDKDCAKRLVAAAGVATPAGRCSTAIGRPPSRALPKLRFPRLRQAGLRRFEQRHPDDQHRPRFRRAAAGSGSTLRRLSPAASWSRSSSTATN